MTVRLRTASRDEMEWVNARYAEIDFQPSDFDRETVAVAEVDDERAGVGRLVRIDDTSTELGGIYVLDRFRRLGLGRKLVEFLLDRGGTERIYCLPFEHLTDFYRDFGFDPVPGCADLPVLIREKMQWCSETHCSGTVVLAREPEVAS